MNDLNNQVEKLPDLDSFAQFCERNKVTEEEGKQLFRLIDAFNKFLELSNKNGLKVDIQKNVEECVKRSYHLVEEAINAKELLSR